MINNVLVTRSGRKLEVKEYGDATGHPVLFFHGMIGSHYQASYIADQAGQEGFRVIAPNRPGVGLSEFVKRKSPLEAVDDVEDIATALGLDEFSVIGISGGTPYALATLYRLGRRIQTVTVISGMGPMRLRGAVRSMDRRRRMVLEIGSRYPHLAMRFFQKARYRFRAGPERFLDRLVSTWSRPDQLAFQRKDVYDLFMKDLQQVFIEGKGPETLSQELAIYRHYGFSVGDLPADKRVTLWHGLADNIVPASMAWAMTHTLPNSEAHFVPGGHFVAVDIAGQIICRLEQLLADPADARAAVGRG
jgi:pimeloyl-ACP methyl ester carboxylesterase